MPRCAAAAVNSPLIGEVVSSDVITVPPCPFCTASHTNVVGRSPPHKG